MLSACLVGKLVEGPVPHLAPPVPPPILLDEDQTDNASPISGISLKKHHPKTKFSTRGGGGTERFTLREILTVCKQNLASS